MKFTDYTLLAVTKIRTRKLRSLLSMLAAGVLVTFLLVGSFSYTGTRNSIENAAPPGLKDKHIGVEDAYSLEFSFQNFEIENEVLVAGPPGKYIDESEYKAKVAPFNPVAYHTHSNINADFWSAAAGDECTFGGEGFLFGDVSLLGKGECVRGAVRSDELFDYFTDDAHKLADNSGSSIPVLINNQYALTLASEQFGSSDSPEDKIAKVARAKDAVLGDEIGLKYRLTDIQTEADSKTIQVKIVGIVPDNSILKEIAGIESSSTESAAVIMPKSLAPVDVKQQDEIIQPEKELRLTEFATVGDLTRYTKAGCQGDACYNGSSSNQTRHSYFTNYGQAIEQSFAEAWSFLRWVVLVWGVGVGLSIMSTTAKVIVDSRKEIGVFRAIGAKRSQIFGIYATYVTMLALASFVFSFIIARLISMLQDSKWADDLSVQIALLNGSSQPRGHFSFFGINLTHLLAIITFVLVVALLGSAIPVIRNLRKDPLRYLRDD